MKERWMGLDYGTKTVGVAVSDVLGITAQGVETVTRKSNKKLRQTLARIEALIELLFFSIFVFKWNTLIIVHIKPLSSVLTSVLRLLFRNWMCIHVTLQNQSGRHPVNAFFPVLTAHSAFLQNSL